MQSHVKIKRTKLGEQVPTEMSLITRGRTHILLMMNHAYGYMILQKWKRGKFQEKCNLLKTIGFFGMQVDIGRMSTGPQILS